MTAERTLDELAEAISNHIAGLTTGWVEHALGLCVDLAKARSCFSANIAFGKWFDAQGFKMNHQTRAAAIAMGQEPDRARKALEDSNSRSIEVIYKQKFSFTNFRKTTTNPRPVRPDSADKRDRAFAAHDRIKEAGEPLTHRAVQEEAGVSGTVVRAVFTAREVEQRVEDGIAAEARRVADMEEMVRLLTERINAYEARLTPGQRKAYDKSVEGKHFEAWMRHAIAAATEHAIHKWKAETGADFFERRLDDVERRFTEWPYSALRKAEYNLILRCIHPDTGAHVSPEQRAEATRILTINKLKLVHDRQEIDNTMTALKSGMPKTVEEMLARKKAKATA